MDLNFPTNIQLIPTPLFWVGSTSTSSTGGLAADPNGELLTADPNGEILTPDQ